MELQQGLVKKTNSKEAYDEIAEQIFELREQRQQAAMNTVQRDEQISRITDLQDFIKAQFFFVTSICTVDFNTPNFVAACLTVPLCSTI